MLGPAVLQDLSALAPTDSVSLELGNKDGLTFCGDREFKIISTGHENYLSYNSISQTLTLLSVDDADIGTNIEITIESYLADYETVTSTDTFFVTIGACFVTSLTAVSTPDQEYQI